MKKLLALFLLAFVFSCFLPSANAAGVGHKHHKHAHHHHHKK